MQLLIDKHTTLFFLNCLLAIMLHAFIVVGKQLSLFMFEERKSRPIFTSFSILSISVVKKSISYFCYIEFHHTIEIKLNYCMMHNEQHKKTSSPKKKPL
jgi:hypothetical protein